MSKDIIEPYGDLANQIWDKMVQLIGIHAVTILVQRAVWETQEQYPEARGLVVSESGIDLTGLGGQMIDDERIKRISEDFFGSLVSILARLVGADIAKKLEKELDGIISREGDLT